MADSALIEPTCEPEAKPKATAKTRLLTLGDLDRRTAAYRETRKLIDDIEGDLGGVDRLSTGMRQLVQRAAVLGAVLTDTAARWIEGEPFDLQAYCTGCNAERRTWETIGLEFQPRDVTPTLAQYLAGKAEAA
jgi:hypothetical protein